MERTVKKIIDAYSGITGNQDRDSIINTLNKSETFRQILEGNPVYLYEGYSANLSKIAQELQSMEEQPVEIKLITPSSITDYNKTMRLQKIEKRIADRNLNGAFLSLEEQIALASLKKTGLGSVAVAKCYKRKSLLKSKNTSALLTNKNVKASTRKSLSAILNNVDSKKAATVLIDNSHTKNTSIPIKNAAIVTQNASKHKSIKDKEIADFFRNGGTLTAAFREYNTVSPKRIRKIYNSLISTPRNRLVSRASKVEIDN